MTLPAHDAAFRRDQVSIGVTQVGDATAHHALVMLHGLASNATRWHEFMQHSTLLHDFTLFAMDLRGHGRSLTFKRYTRQDWLEDVHQLLINAPHETTILAGHSLGAQIALDYASEYGVDRSTRLTGLVLIDPIFPQALDGILKRVAQFRWLLPPVCWLLRGAYALGLRRRQYPYRDLHALDQQTRTYLQANPEKGIADLYMNPLADLAYLPLANYLQDLYEVTRPLKSLARINIPVLVLLSTGASTSQVEQNRRILGEISGLEIKAIDADHWLLTEKPVEAREAIDQWCRKVTGL